MQNHGNRFEHFKFDLQSQTEILVVPKNCNKVEPADKASFFFLKLRADEANGSNQWKMTH